MAFKFKSSGTKFTDPVVANATAPKLPIGIKTPMSLGDNRSGIFAMNFELRDQVEDNLRNLLLTNYGERLGKFDFGANLRSLVSEVTSGEDFESRAMNQIQDSVTKYMPYVSLESFGVEFDKNPPKGMAVANIRMQYTVQQAGIFSKSISVKIYAVG